MDNENKNSEQPRKKILIIGEKSYIGKSFETFAKDKYAITIISSRNHAWRSIDFMGYDSILHCAGIAHVSHNQKMKNHYYEVNCELALNVANKAKSENVSQFIFLSSILVYGTKGAEINNETIPNPDDFYGDSKLKAEQELQKMADDNFKLCIIRPPLVYGSRCKGNFQKLVSLAKVLPVFPDYPNIRSMIYVDNLCNFLCNLINNNDSGIFLPQNNEYVNTTKLVCLIAECYNRQLYTTELFNPFIHFMIKHVSTFKKMFGNLYYASNVDSNNITMVDLKNSIKNSIDV